MVGAGQAGLACARLLLTAGIDVVVLERDRVGSTWRSRYERLTLNTERRLSALPGHPLPASAGRWVSREDFVSYLESYAEGLPVRAGVEVTRLDPTGEGWRVLTGDGAALSAAHVVVATGANQVPHLPDWPGSLDVPLLHSGSYCNPDGYGGKTVLVVGAGNSGSEIAADLSGTARVLLSVRTPPALFPRAIGPLPMQLAAFPLPLVPSRLGDLALSATMRLWRRSDAALGLPVPRRPVSAARRGEVPVLDAGLRAAVGSGRVEVVPAVERLAGKAVVLVDGSAVHPDVVIAATGWRPALAPLIGHLGLLGPSGLPTHLPTGLHLVGFGAPITGYIHAAGYDAASVVSAVTGGSSLGAALTGIRRRLPLPA